MISSDPLQILIESVFALLEAWAFIFSVLGNFLVIYVMTREKKLRRKSNYYIISVAIADLLIGLIGIPGSIFMRWTGEPRDFNLCLTITSSLLVMYIVSIFSLVAVSVDRYIAICHPLVYRKIVCARTTTVIICICWVLGTIGFIPLLRWNAGEPQQERCRPAIVLGFYYIIFLCVFVSIIPTGFIIVVYILIFHKIITQSKVRSSMVLSKRDIVESTLKKECKAAKTLSMIVGSFLVCWLPMTISYFSYTVIDHKFSEDILKIFTILLHFNSAIDPLIYAFRIKEVRLTIKKSFKCFRQKCCCQSLEDEE